jgi:hypothetical protein
MQPKRFLLLIDKRVWLNVGSTFNLEHTRFQNGECNILKPIRGDTKWCTSSDVTFAYDNISEFHPYMMEMNYIISKI